MQIEEERVIPRFIDYTVTEYGEIRSLEWGQVIRQYLFDGYYYVEVFQDGAWQSLRVHRAVALAWVPNPNPEILDVVNHLDGDRLHNHRSNLEWTDCSGNNYHAVNTGLRSDNIPCKVRDFVTTVVYDFPSVAQAAEFMGMSKDTPMLMLQPKMIGKLVNDRYEFKFSNDPSPWFYQNRKERVPPSRYMVIVREPDGSTREVYSNRRFLKDYQLYDSPSKSMPALAEFASRLHQDKVFIVIDGYAREPAYRERRQTKNSATIPIKAVSNQGDIRFASLTQCASHFNVDRSSISNRLGNGKALNGWYFMSNNEPL